METNRGKTPFALLAILGIALSVVAIMVEGYPLYAIEDWGLFFFSAMLFVVSMVRGVGFDLPQLIGWFVIGIFWILPNIETIVFFFKGFFGSLI